MQKRSRYSFWQIIVVICETNWIFVGLYVLSRWKDDWLAWIMSRNFWSYLQAMGESIVAPVGSRPPPWCRSNCRRARWR